MNMYYSGDTTPPDGLTAKQIDNPYGYCGYYADLETLGINGGGNGFLYHVRFLVYDPITGRWLQRDPAGFIDGMNLYEYCGGGAISAFDPFGLTTSTNMWGAVKAIGGALEFAAGAVIGVAAGWTGVGAVVAVVLMAHGADTFQAGARQAAYGTPTQTFTSLGVEHSVGAGAEAMGAPEGTAHVIGEVVDSLIGIIGVAFNPAAGIPLVAKVAGVTSTGYLVLVNGTAGTVKAKNILIAVVFMHAAANGASSGGSEGDSSDSAPQVGKNISAQKQSRHVKGHKNWHRDGEGSYFDDAGDAQAVLDAYHSGEATKLGTTKQGHILVEYNGATGYNNNRGAGYVDQPTHRFMI